jgi:cbb3-type cytochrome oxidase maturation protein
LSVIFILIAVSLLVAIGFLGSFIWSIRSGQYEDEYTPSVRILFDDEKNVIEDPKNSKFQIPNSKKTPSTKNQEQTTKNQEPRTKNQ